jgi:serine protease AprX
MLRRCCALILAGAFSAPALASVSEAALSKMSPFLRRSIMADEAAKTSAMIILSKQADLSGATKIADPLERRKWVVEKLRSTARASQPNLLDQLDAKKVRYQPFYIHNMVAVFDVDARTLSSIVAQDMVVRAVGNPVIRVKPEVFLSQNAQDEETGIGANISSIGADRVWTEFSVKGEGIVVAGQDTGYEWGHPALKASYRGWNGTAADHNYNWHDAIHEPIGSSTTNKCGYNAVEPCDDDQHGTHTMGTIVGDDGRGNQVGVAPGAKWIGCRNMDAGFGRPSSYIECFEFFLAPFPIGGDAMTDGDPARAPHVINNSWGCTTEEGCSEAETLPVMTNLKAAGIMVVASAGNEGSGCASIAAPPAMHSDETLSVGAHNHADGKIAYFSSRGPSKHDNKIGPDITAPGVSIRSSIPGGGFSGAMWSGTSMAGPHVVGAVALLWAADTSLIGSIDATVEVFRNTATAKTSTETCGGVAGSARPNNTFGWGHLDAYKAVSSRR